MNIDRRLEGVCQRRGEDPRLQLWFLYGNGQHLRAHHLRERAGVPNVEVSLETTADISGKSYRMTGEYYLEVNDSTFLKNKKENDGDKDFIVRSDSLAFQLFAKLDDAALAEKQTLLEKPGMYELYVRNDSLHFKVGSLELKSDSLSAS